MANFQLIVFDWDGTLLDSTGMIAASIQAAARDLGIAEPSDERARHIIGLGLIDALRYAMPGLPPERYNEVAERYRYHYLARDHELLLFPGAAELIKELSNTGFQLAVATGKSRNGLNRALEVSGLGRYFRITRCADECYSKPHPQMLEELIEAFDVAPATTLMIGDTTHDLQMAKNARTHGLGVTYGAHPRPMLEAEAPLFCADNVSQLAAWLRRHG
ncbi:HAD family hydrolase [Rugosibacter aromaticivorans]|uniref:HAD family hydrolase n=1 Tax=Rugosibacter aromaticivorans TaxID=1565605 RepID=A0A0C5J7W5_9PROT|nr:HAD-IA family hydrolase [Rugosibacter aromaticivorans]AJP48040.1 HAD family hydrolase [Rugosibacter aromaticivorans]TBR14953.1 MAG: HAD family hydrolase [Rugosibacter sp.]